MCGIGAQRALSAPPPSPLVLPVAAQQLALPLLDTSQGTTREATRPPTPLGRGRAMRSTSSTAGLTKQQRAEERAQLLARLALLEEGGGI